MALYVILDSGGAIITVYSCPQPGFTTTQIATSDAKWKAYYNALPLTFRGSVPAPT